MTGIVYFVQPVGGGLIKIGSTYDIANRVGSMSCMSPAPLEVLATIPGFRCREAALHHLFAPIRAHGEWFRACPALWRTVIEAVDTGDVSWLPALPDDQIPHAAVGMAAMRSSFGGRRNVASALGYRALPPMNMMSMSPKHWGKFQAVNLLQSGAVPAYVAALHGAPSSVADTELQPEEAV